MNLVADQPIDHMHAVGLEFFGPLDVVGLVEPRAQFDHGGDLLAVFDRAHEGAD
jgi:hypothetical protein